MPLRAVMVWFAVHLLVARVASAQQASLDTALRLQDSFAYHLELQRQSPFKAYVDSLIASDEQQRAAQLEVLNQSSFTTLLGLTRFIPLRFKPEIDTFFLQNYMRPDLNPIADDKIFSGVKLHSRVSIGFDRN